jgi:hypothetical protein
MNRLYLLLLLLISLPVLVMAQDWRTSSSILATGTWYKIAVNQNGIHKVTYADMEALGMDVSSVDPANIRLFGNGGGMLPEPNDMPRIDDLRENAIRIHDGGDGQWDPGDYFIFYGEDPNVWHFDSYSKTFTHEKNLYSDFTYYFLTTDLGPGKRVEMQASLDSASFTTIRFTDHQVQDNDLLNLIRSGKIWVGEIFDNNQPAMDVTFYFPNAITTSSARINTYAVSRSPNVCTMNINLNGEFADSFNLDSTNPQSTSTYARPKLHGTYTKLPADNTTITLEYEYIDPQSIAWLNYIEVIGLRFLRWVPSQMSFRDPNNIGSDKNTQYVISDAITDLTVWDVTDPGDTKEIEGTWDESTKQYKYIVPTPDLREFIAFDGTQFLSVIPVGIVQNQDLHALNPADLIIVAHPDFLTEAQRLAAFHEGESGISVLLETTDRIYNEFGSGMPDITAIRDFIRMLWLKGSGSGQPKYVLLFGDGSYDFKNRIPNNTNFVPAFQSEESFKFIATFVTDDYYGVMGESGGLDAAGRIEIGMGRFPVSTQEQAIAMVDKIIEYARKNDTTQSAWRNEITFVADDEDVNLHLHQAEELAGIVENKYPVFNVGKIYLDAYQIVQTPSGGRYPKVNDAINSAVNSGKLILNYTGHGGEDAWSGEKVLTIPDIESWNNKGKYPVFITATCEFSRFDNPERFSAGEMVIVKPDAGAVALYTTTRLALATSNFRLDTSFFRHLMDQDEDGNYLKMGDLLRISKNNNGNNNKIRNFVLLGDPAQSIAFPKYEVVTTQINGAPVNPTADTLLGMSTVTISGVVQDQQGNQMTGFNGLLQTTVYDKPVTYRTLANQPKSYKENFQMQNIVLSSGPAEIKEGAFTFSFIVPQGISPYFGFGKISYYGSNELLDAAGYDDHVVIGGKDPTVIPDNQGPAISVFLDNRSFVSGGRVGKNVLLLADLSDPDGINHIGLGIGQEILAVIDDSWSHSIVLNDYYQPELNGFQSGSVEMPLQNLSVGRHTLTLRAYDLMDNASEETIIFYVFEDPTIQLANVYCFPNPVENGTTFTFETQTVNGPVNVDIDIYTIAGQPVKKLQVSSIATNGVPMQVYWDGRGQNGERLQSGVYPFMVRFYGANDSYTQTSGKVIVL